MKAMNNGVFKKPCIIGYDEPDDALQDDGSPCIAYNMELLGSSVGVLDAIVWLLLILGLIMDVLCYKYRYLANAYIYLNMAYYLMSRMVPNSEAAAYENQPFQMGYITMAHAQLYYIDQSFVIIIQPIITMIHFFFTGPIIFSYSMNAMRFL